MAGMTLSQPTVKTTEKVEITFGIPEQTDVKRTFILFGVSFLTSKFVGFLTIILKNKNFGTKIKRAKHKYFFFSNKPQYSRY